VVHEVVLGQVPFRALFIVHLSAFGRRGGAPCEQAVAVGLRLVFADPDDPVYGLFGGGTDQEGCRFHG
jgi:hypothetical protein